MKLPQTVYVTSDLNSDDLKGLLAFRGRFDAAEDDEQTMGIYQLVTTKRIRKIAQIR